jgi:hypothetical protein
MPQNVEELKAFIGSILELETQEIPGVRRRSATEFDCEGCCVISYPQVNRGYQPIHDTLKHERIPSNPG